MNETYLTVVGRVATAVKCWMLPNGDPVAKFRIASSERRRPSSGDEWVDGDSLFVQVTCWRQLAENVVASLGVGDPVMVRGRLYTDEWEWDGKPRTEVKLEAHAVGPDLRWCKAEVTRMRRGDARAGSVAVAQPALPGTDGATDMNAGRAVPAGVGADRAGTRAPSDDQRERLGAPVEAGVGA